MEIKLELCDLHGPERSPYADGPERSLHVEGQERSLCADGPERSPCTDWPEKSARAEAPSRRWSGQGEEDEKKTLRRGEGPRQEEEGNDQERPSEGSQEMHPEEIGKTEVCHVGETQRADSIQTSCRKSRQSQAAIVIVKGCKRKESQLALKARW